MRERPALLLYCQHALGMGHLARSLVLARALAERFHVVFLNGGPVPRGVARPRGVTFVDLPPLGFDAEGRLVSRDGRRSVARAEAVRRATILQTFRELRPEVVVVELFPFGRKKFAGELLPLFDAVQALGSTRPLLVSSLRDILVTGRKNQADHDARASALANRYLDAVLVHADPRFVRLEESFRPPEPLRVPVHYTGFVLGERNAAPIAAERVVVSAGGGVVGGPLFRAALEAQALLWRTERLPMTLVAGPFLPADEWRVLARARKRPGLVLRRSVASLEDELRRAAVSVSQCGYNTALELVRARVPAIVVPFRERDEDEQWARARRLEQLGIVRALDPDRLDGATLAEEIRRVREWRPAAVALDLDGARGTTDLLLVMLERRKRQTARRAVRRQRGGHGQLA
jgi:predicted glycosyltransferase